MQHPANKDQHHAAEDRGEQTCAVKSGCAAAGDVADEQRSGDAEHHRHQQAHLHRAGVKETGKYANDNATVSVLVPIDARDFLYGGGKAKCNPICRGKPARAGRSLRCVQPTAATLLPARIRSLVKHRRDTLRIKIFSQIHFDSCAAAQCRISRASRHCSMGQSGCAGPRGVVYLRFTTCARIRIRHYHYGSMCRGTTRPS